jgi:hypothetical protein
MAHRTLQHCGVRQRDRHHAVNAPRFVLRLLCAFVLLSTRPTHALAADKRDEAAAHAALKAAVTDYLANDFDQAIVRLRKAAKACAPSRCTEATAAALLRDIGVMQLAQGESDKASASFLEALVTDPSLDWNPAYDRQGLRSEWDAAKDEASVFGREQPTGDLATVPPAEQVARTALPIYVDYGGKLASVIVKYKATGMTDFKKVRLSHMGKGWGGSIPCADVVRGVMRYYVQGFDESDTPVAITGDPRHPLYVPIRWSISSAPPHLPGQEPPAPCGVGGQCPAGAACGESISLAPTATLDNGEVCETGGQCTSGRCSSGRCAATRTLEGAAGGYVHFWFGVAGSVDVTYVPSGTDVCLLNAQAVPANSPGYYCTTPYGVDFPTRASPAQNATLVKGEAGQAQGGLESGDVRVLFTFDYAASTHLLLGGRFGVVLNGYPGEAAAHDGRGFGPPIHLELRGTFLFGDRPLAHSGFAPLVLLAGGVGEFDASTTVGVVVSNVAGTRPMVAWKTGGPGFAALGGGLRYAFSPRVAFSAALKFTTAFGGAFFPTMAPELGLQYGF